MVKASIKEKLNHLSTEPGVYRFKDSEKKIIYIGKAANLKKRISSYFQSLNSGKPGIKTRVLISKISDFDIIITKTEKEALILESSLIKKYKPRYNISLRDDKQYPSLKLAVQNPYPNLTISRKLVKDGSLYFGPYTSSQGVNQTLKIINKTFKLRKCKTPNVQKRPRPCLDFQMGLCLAPCALNVDIKAYKEIANEVILFLKGKTPELIQKIKTDMFAAAKAHQFERATILRDKIFAIEKTLEKQIAVTNDLLDRDVIAIAVSPELAVVTILFVRGGYLTGNRHFEIEETLSTAPEILKEFLRQYYEKATFIPKEVLVPETIDGARLIEESISALRNQAFHIKNPRRGEKVKLIHLAMKNAENRLRDVLSYEKTRTSLLSMVQKKLNLKHFPNRVECFDNSNILGTEPVAGMVVFEKGVPSKSQYRKYKIKTVSIPDDYAYMEEVLRRRYGKGKASEPYPNLLLVDGGKGQLNIAARILDEYNLQNKFDIAGIAKKDELRGEKEDKIYLQGRTNPVNLERGGEVILFLKRIRDEAHRFALAYHRKRRTTAGLLSVLDNIPGIGPKKKQLLLDHFGGITGIRKASTDELCLVPGMNHRIATTLKHAVNHEYRDVDTVE